MASRKGGNRKSSKALSSYGPGEELTLIKLISKNQREINGMIFKALKEIIKNLAALQKAQKGPNQNKAANDLLGEAKKYIAKVPGFDPPGCNTGR
ncbi:MAG TPA: hypothetical protein VFQ43_01965 [Nitrososphaera sp.]|nr:hypothetical protein [Nitrososphaera sp.]